jgi:hypothetical protein
MVQKKIVSRTKRYSSSILDAIDRAVGAIGTALSDAHGVVTGRYRGGKACEDSKSEDKGTHVVSLHWL